MIEKWKKYFEKRLKKVWRVYTKISIIAETKKTTNGKRLHPYSEEWKKEISKQPKNAIVEIAAKIGSRLGGRSTVFLIFFCAVG